MYGKRTNVTKRLVILLVVLSIPLLLFSGTIRRFWLARPFSEGQIRQYQKLFHGETRGQVRHGSLPHRTGKVIVIKPSVYSIYVSKGLPVEKAWTEIRPSYRSKISREVDPPRLDDSWYKLDSSVRASTPAEVDTVIFCERRTHKEGVKLSKDPAEYTGPRSAYRRDFVLLVYDRHSGKFIGKYFVQGEDAPDKLSSKGYYEGESQDVSEIIAGMPLQDG